MLVEFFILLSVCLFLFYKWFTVHYDFFKKRNIPFEKPVPFFGSHKDVIFQKISIRDHLNEMYKKFHKHKVFGFFDQRTPIYCIRDPDIAKLVTVEKFDHFVNHILILDDHFSGLLGKSLFFMKNEKWKDMRVTLSPVFTAKKMRLMFELINAVAYESIEYLKKNITDQTEFEINHKDYFSRFTNDVIGSVVFGLNVNSFKDVKNEFYLMGKKVTSQTLWQRIKFFFFPALKHILKLLKQEVFDEGAMKYFTHIVLDTMKYRHQNNIYRPDMVNMLMEAKGLYVNKDETDKVVAKGEWTDIDLVAQLYLFFFAGFETTSSLMAFATYEIMENPDIQDRLRAEILEVKKSLNGKPLTYDVVHNMKYMGMVVSETLRKWSPGFFLDTQCNKNFSYKDDDVEINIKAGDYVWIPVIGFHLDEQYFPDPLKFDPERFSEENKQNIKPFTYLPFGIGPRFCIGGRFALIQTKTILFYLLSEYRVEVCPKTARPLQIDPKNFNVAAKGGFWAKLVKLQS